MGCCSCIDEFCVLFSSAFLGVTYFERVPAVVVVLVTAVAAAMVYAVHFHVSCVVPLYMIVFSTCLCGCSFCSWVMCVGVCVQSSHTPHGSRGKYIHSFIQPRGAAAGSPGRNIWRMGMGRKGAGDGSCVPLEKGRRGNSAVTNGRWALPWLNWSGDR